MNGEATDGPRVAGPPSPADRPGQPRAWTPAAAMEPVPPLAPPPARPGAGTPVFPSAREASSGAPTRGVLIVVAMLVIGALAVLVLVLHH